MLQRKKSPGHASKAKGKNPSNPKQPKTAKKPREDVDVSSMLAAATQNKVNI